MMESFLQFVELRDTAHHIDLVQSKLDRLSAAKADSWEQLLTAVARMYRAGDLTAAQLLAFHREMHHSYGPGFTKVWDRNVAIPSQKLRHVAAREERISRQRDGALWSGTWPVKIDDLVPPRGMCVVYVLLDRDGVPAYIGSTEQFRGRMNAHDKKWPDVFERWVLYPCDDREAAYELEVRLLREKLPYLNRKVGR